MRYLKKFNEDIEHKDIQEQIDEVLENLSKKGELSNSEKQFMDDASKGKVIDVTIPKSSGNFWSDMSNPHNVGIMWNNGESWNILKTLEKEEDERLQATESSDDTFERRRYTENINYLKSNPGLKEDLEKLLEMQKAVSEFAGTINKKYRKNDSHNFNQKLDYATNGKIDSLINQFGYYNWEISDDASKAMEILDPSISWSEFNKFRKAGKKSL